jgi:hypothetical protein
LSRGWWDYPYGFSKVSISANSSTGELQVVGIADNHGSLEQLGHALPVFGRHRNPRPSV